MKQLIVLCSLIFPAISFANFEVDYAYHCEKTVKPFGNGKDEFVQIPERGTEYILRVGNFQHSFLMIQTGGPWFSLESVQSGYRMVFGIESCFKEYPQPERFYVHLNCTDKIKWVDEGHGYYDPAGKWYGPTHISRELPEIYGDSLQMDRALWSGIDEGTLTTFAYTNHTYTSEENTLRTLYKCSRIHK